MLPAPGASKSLPSPSFSLCAACLGFGSRHKLIFSCRFLGDVGEDGCPQSHGQRYSGQEWKSQAQGWLSDVHHGSPSGAPTLGPSPPQSLRPMVWSLA